MPIVTTSVLKSVLDKILGSCSGVASKLDTLNKRAPRAIVPGTCFSASTTSTTFVTFINTIAAIPKSALGEAWAGAAGFKIADGNGCYLSDLCRDTGEYIVFAPAYVKVRIDGATTYIRCYPLA